MLRKDKNLSSDSVRFPVLEGTLKHTNGGNVTKHSTSLIRSFPIPFEIAQCLSCDLNLIMKSKNLLTLGCQFILS